MLPCFAYLPGGGSVVVAPTLASLNFALSDIAGGGTALVATGTNCTGVTAVNVWGTTVTPTATTATTVTFTAPAHAAGTTTVSLTAPGGTSGTLAFESWSPSQITGISAYLDSNKGLTTTPPFVTTWIDQSSNARSFGQSVGANRPTQVASVFGNLPSINFVPQAWVELSPKVVLASGLSFFAVGKWTAVAGSIISDNIQDYDRLMLGASGSLDFFCYDSAGATPTTTNRGTALNTGTARLVGVTSDTTPSVKLYSGTTQLGATATPAGGYPTTAGGYSAVGNQFAGGNGFAGDLGAVVAVNGVISAGDLTKLNAWSQQRFGTP